MLYGQFAVATTCNVREVTDSSAFDDQSIGTELHGATLLCLVLLQEPSEF